MRGTNVKQLKTRLRQDTGPAKNGKNFLTNI